MPALRLVAALIWLAGAAWGDLYPDATLEAAKARMGPNIEAMVRDIARTVPRADRPLAGRVTVELPLRGRHPLDIFADPATQRIFVPIETVRFFDDLAILQSWFTARGCDATPIQTYLWALLRRGRDLPSPLEAFGLDRDTLLADAFTDDVSGKVLKSGIFFILSHEMGHVVRGHLGGQTGPFSQAQERESDAFAMDRFADIGTVPGGAALFFTAARWLDPTGVAKAAGSHPIAPDRIAAIGTRLQADPRSFAFSEPNLSRAEAQVRQIAEEFQRIAELSSEDAMLTLLPRGLEEGFPLTQLTRACPAN